MKKYPDFFLCVRPSASPGFASGDQLRRSGPQALHLGVFNRIKRSFRLDVVCRPDPQATLKARHRHLNFVIAIRLTNHPAAVGEPAMISILNRNKPCLFELPI
ncbi:MAG: hypothetical protein HQK60_19215 [Deltaproteobacteria bacterium]|nr:hypothetical protein [Deltaproteobacteria bacterium]